MTDSTSIPPIYTAATLKSPRRPLVIAILAGFGLLLTGCGAVSIYLAFCPDQSIPGRILLSTLAVTCLFLPLTYAAASTRLKLTTGRWTLPPEQRVARLRNMAGKPPSRISNIIRSPWVNRSLNVLTIAAAGIMIGSAYRSGFHRAEVFIAIIWIAIAALSLWQMTRRRLGPTVEGTSE